MPITAYTGLPRHGKSYGVVENVIAPALKKGRIVYTNIPMKDEVCQERFGHTAIQFDIQDIVKNPDWFTEVFQKGALFVADEIWELWPSGLKSNNALVQHKTFLAKHGHLVGEDGQTTSIVFVTQDLGQLAAFARQLVETTFIVHKLINVGQPNRYHIEIFSGSQTGLTPPISKRLSEQFGIRKQEIHDLYVSQTESETGFQGDETQMDQRFNVLKSSKLKTLIFSFIGLIFAVVFLINYFLDNNSYSNKDNVEQSPVPEHSQPDKLLDNVKLSKLKPREVIETQKQILPEKINDVLLNSDKILVVGSIVMIDKENPKSLYQYKILSDGSFTLLSKSELTNLGYTVNVINPCLSTIQGFKKAYYAMCKDPEMQSNGFMTIPKD